MHTFFGVQALSGGTTCMDAGGRATQEQLPRGLGEGKLIQESAMNLTNKARSLRKNKTDVEQLV